MAGQVKGHSLVAKLPVGHAVAVFILGVDEPRQQVVARMASCPAGGNEAIDHSIQLAHGPMQADVCNCREPKRQANEATKSVAHQLECEAQCHGEMLAIARIVQVEERLERDCACERAELEMN